MNTKINHIDVIYNNRTVGYLKQLQDGSVSFQYCNEWLKDGFSISPFSLPLENKIFISKHIEMNFVYGVFWDCLPQGWGQKILQKSLTKEGIDYRRLDMIPKLSFTTSNARGALRFRPCQYKAKFPEYESLDQINSIAHKLMNNEESKDEQNVLLAYSSSSGGAKPKVHLKINNEEWIIKLNLESENLGLNEFNANKLAQECGIHTNEFKLFDSKVNKGYFGAKRFDIDKNSKPIHMISLCGLLETTPSIPDLDYSILLQVINKISINKLNDLLEAFRRMVFNVLYGNKDDHGGNWSFLYDEQNKGYTLAPFYDITNTGNLFPEHEMSVLGKGNPSIDDMLELAKKFNLPIAECKSIIEKIKKVLNK